MERSHDRARRHTARSVLRRIDDDTVGHLMEVAQKPETASRRLEALDREWDMDRTIEAEAAAMGLMGLALGAFVRPAFLAMPATVGAAVFLFGTRGIYPLLPIFRRLGVRTALEIERERYAVKALRGDFDSMAQEQQPGSAADRSDDAAPLRH
ncbi:hypothetical protein WG922_12640 [Ramlibacter sp. AN1015]|uniref:hypothetical protein n=1 Tax=Ramlibacter sp. AN1015 TaxID=3133428 RepID=UPI0030C19C6C